MTAVLAQCKGLYFHDLGMIDLKKTFFYRPEMTSFNQFPDNRDKKEKEPYFYECYKAVLSSTVFSSHL